MLSKKKQLEKIGIRADDPFNEIRLILKYKYQNATPFQISENQKSKFYIPYTTRRRIKKIFDLENEILAIIDSVDAIDDATYDTPQQHRLETTEITPRVRYEEFEKLTELAPKSLFNYQSISKLYPEYTNEDIVLLLMAYDTLMLEVENQTKIIDKLNELSEPYDQYGSIPNFAGIDGLFKILVETYYRTINTDMPQAILQTAVSLYVAGINKSNTHLIIAGESMIRYSYWINEDNQYYYYESLRKLCTSSNQHQRLIQQIKKQIEWNQTPFVDRDSLDSPDIEVK